MTNKPTITSKQITVHYWACPGCGHHTERYTKPNSDNSLLCGWCNPVEEAEILVVWRWFCGLPGEEQRGILEAVYDQPSLQGRTQPHCQIPVHDNCCCVCRHRLEDHSHPWTDGEEVVRRRGWVCAGTLEETGCVHSGWAEHGLCELFDSKLKGKVNDDN